MTKIDPIKNTDDVIEAAIVPVVRPQVPAATPDSLLEIAVKRGADIAEIEKLMELQLRWEANDAKKAFYAAKAKFNKACPAVIKDKDNKQYGSKYASIGEIVNTALPVLGEYGLSPRWNPTQSEDTVTVECILSHINGHSESATMSGPPDKSGSKNIIQQMKSTFTYLRSATFEAVTGIASSDESADDDGNSCGVEYVSVDQMTEINDALKSTKSDANKFLKFYKADSVEHIRACDYKDAIARLKRKAGAT